MTPATLESSLRRVLRSEGFLAALARPVSQPEPNAVDAEQTIVAAVLTGDARPVELEPLESRDIYADGLRAIYGVLRAAIDAGIRPSAEFVLRALAEQGVTGRAIAQELATLRDCTPVCCREPLRELALRVHEYGRRRRVLEALERIATELRAGVIDADTAVRRLGEVTE